MLFIGGTTHALAAENQNSLTVYGQIGVVSDTVISETIASEILPKREVQIILSGSSGQIRLPQTGSLNGLTMMVLGLLLIYSFFFLKNKYKSSHIE